MDVRTLLERVKNGELSSADGLRAFKKLKDSQDSDSQTPNLRTTPNPEEAAVAKSGTVYCRSEWAPCGEKDAPVEIAPTGSLLIFDTDEVLRDEIKSQLTEAVPLILVKPGEDYEQLSPSTYQINPARKRDYELLFGALKEQQLQPQYVIHLWSRENLISSAEASQHLERGFRSLLLISQVLLEQRPSGKTTLLYLHEFSATKWCPLRSAVSGFARTLNLENPHLFCRTVELCPDTAVNSSQWLEVLRREIAEQSTDETEVRYEHGRRFTKRLIEIDKEVGRTVPIPIREDGVYLITGGVGALGLIFAEYLAAKSPVKLVLTGRSPLTVEKKDFIRQLEARGAEVVYCPADVSDPNAVRELITKTKSRFKAIHGVIHAAGVIRDAFLLKKTADEVEEVLAPKVAATFYLDEALKEEKLDFFVLFSSLVGLIGNPGQSDYAYASSFLDHFAMFREQLRLRQERFGQTLSINWPLWSAGGMAVSEDAKVWAQRVMGVVPISREDGIKAFADGLSLAHPQLTVLAGDPEKLRSSYHLDPVSELSSRAITPTISTKPISKNKREHLLASAIAFLKTVLSREIKLPVAKIHSDHPLEKYGIDSMMIVNLTREMEELYGALPKTLFFEYQNIRELAEYFVQNHAEKLDELHSLETQSKHDRGQIQKAPAGSTGKSRFLIPKREKLSLNGNGNGHHANGNGNGDGNGNGNGNGHQVSKSLSLNFGTRDEGIAIIGMAGRYPGAETPDEFWENLKSGKDCITEIPRDRWDYRPSFDSDKDQPGKSYSKWGGFIEDVDKFDPLFFNISPREAELMDPQERLFLETAWQTFEDAGYTRAKLANYRGGVFVGVMYGQYQLFGAEETLKGNPIAPGNFFASIANRVSYFFNLRGPSIALDTLCSSSLTAIHLACESISRGEIEVAIAGGVNVTIHPSKYLNLSQGKFASSDGRCRSFGEGGDGYVPGEGVGAILLKSLSRAIADGDHIYAAIRNTAINHGGRTNGVTVPNPKAQSELIADALKSAGIQPRAISYLEAHGTGTALGDPIEIAGLTKAFRNSGEELYASDTQYCAIGSVKSNIGHLESAAGIAGLMKVLLQMNHGQLAPSLHSENLNSNIDFPNSPFYVQRELSYWKRPRLLQGNEKTIYPRLAGISSFGAGGANAHIILEEHVQPVDREIEPAPQLILLSARNQDRLKAYAAKLIRFLERRPVDERHDFLSNFAFTLQVGREAMQERLALVVINQGELIEKLNQYCDETGNGAGAYSGSIDNDNQVGRVLIEGETGTSLLSALMKAGDLSKLAQLWVAGAEIDWQLLHDDSHRSRIPLPTYPFAKERCWIPISKNPLTPVGDGRLHPLLDENTSDLDEQKFTKSLHQQEFFLADHTVEGRKILPGVAVLEMARAAGSLAGRGQVQSVKDTSWVSPIIFDPDRENKINISLYPGTAVVDYEVWSLRDGDYREVHAQGKLIFGELNSDPETLDLKGVLLRCGKTLAGEECYRRFHQHGLDYGPRFRSIRELHFNEIEAVAHLQLPRVLQADFGAYSYHPALLDGALQAVAGLLLSAEVESKALHVPFLLGEIQQFRPLTEIVYAHVTRAVEGAETASIEKFNIHLADEEGQLLIRISDFSIRAVGQVGAQSTQNKEAVDETILYRPVWKEKPITQTLVKNEHRRSGSEAVLVFDTGEEVRKELNQRLQLENSLTRAILVKPGDAFSEVDEDSYVIRPAAKDDYVRLLASLSRRSLFPERVLHLWSYRDIDDKSENLSRQLDRGFYSNFYLTQALMEQKAGRPISLLYVYPAREGLAQPAGAAFSALAKCIRLENPRLSYRTLSLDASALDHADGVTSHLERILQEFEVPAKTDDEVRYQGEVRQVRFWDEHNRSETDGQQNAEKIIKEGGTYLITGGAGGLGLIFAEHLASKAKVRLILTGRSPLSADTSAKLRTLERHGGDVVYLRCDIAQRDEARSLVSEINSRFGNINGVIHAAGVTRDSFILNKSSEDISAVLAPKVYGTQWLDEATASQQLDFFVLFSSAAGALGNVGQSDYAFANCFVDHFALQREALRAQNRRFGKTLSINWPLWLDGGLQTSEEVRARMRKTMGLAPLKTIDGLHVFAAGLQSPHAQLLVLSGDRKKIEQAICAVETEPVSSDESEATRPEAAQGSVAGELLIQSVELYLKRILSAELKLPVDRISAREPLEQYGIDSVTVMNLTRQLEEYFGELSKTLFFEYRTIAELGRYFVEHHRNTTIVKFAGTQETATSPRLLPETNAAISVKRPRFRKLEHHSPGGQTVEHEDVAIIGISGRYPMADDLVQFWENLQAGKDCVSEVPPERWNNSEVNGGRESSSQQWGGFLNDVDKFDSLFFNISPKEAKIIDPQERLFLETVWHTIEDAGYTRALLENTKTGVFVGAMYAHYQLFSVETAYRDTGFTPSSLHASIANRVSYVCNFRGPSIALDTMCSSSLTAIHLACASLHQGDCEVAIAGGVNLSLHPNKYVALSQAQFASSDGRCRSFGEGGDGYVPGEGVGALMLKPVSKAVADGDHIYGVIKGTAINHGGKTNGYTVPDPVAQGRVIAEALKKSNLNPQKISCLEAHGTGTSLGDPIEIAGLVKAFHEVADSDGASNRQYCSIGSVKSNIGHLESAAGVAGVTKVLLQMKHRQLVPSIHSESPNPHINFKDTPFLVQRKLEPWLPFSDENDAENLRQAGISSFGAGGSNAHIVLEEYRLREFGGVFPESKSQVVTLSARNEERLKVYAGKLADFLNRDAQLTKGTLSTAEDISDKVENDLLSIAGDILKLDSREIDPTEEMTAYGIDPVSSLSLAERISRKFDLELSSSAFNKISNIRELAKHLAEAHEDKVRRYYGGSTAVPSEIQDHTLNLADLAYTLQVGREAMEERLVAVVSSLEELREKLARYSSGESGIEGLYQGNVRHSKARSEVLLEGIEGAEYIQTVIEQHKLQKLAQLWLLGAEIDWQLLHRNADGTAQRRQRLSLPTYPFARIRHWLPESKGTESVSTKSLHPLLGRIDLRRSFLQNHGIVFNRILSVNDPLLRDHKVLGRSILPGVGYLEMARAALAELGKTELFKLTRVVLLQPLAVADQQEVQVVVREKNGLLNFEIQSSDNTTGAPPTTHATGICAQRATATADRVSIANVKARCRDEISKEDLYPQFRAIGIEYGPYYQRVERIWGGDEEALGLLTLPSEYQHELREYVLHPTILDGALQVIAGLTINRRERDELVLPFAIEEVDIIRPLIVPAYAHVKLIEKDRYDVAVLDEDGQVCIRLHDLALRKVKAKDSLSEFFFLPGWKALSLGSQQSGTKRLGLEPQRSESQRTTLLFHPPQLSGLEKALDETHAPASCVWVALGSQTRQLAENRWEIDTHDSAGFDQWLSQFEALDGLYFLGAIKDGETNAAALSALDQSQELGVLSLFRIVKSLIRLGMHRRPLRLRVVTNEAHRVLPGDMVKPFSSSLFGFTKSLAKEHPQWSISSMDIDLHQRHGSDLKPDFSELVHSIVTEPADPKGDEVAIRKGQRYVRSLTPVHLPPVKSTSFREHGVYLILGGAGGIGLELSKYLAQSVQARLVLVGRSALSDEQRRQIEVIESLGGSVLYVRADATDLASMRSVVEQAKASFGSIHGAIHSAIVLKDKTLETMTEEEFRAALLPKVQGSVNLHLALADEALDFMLFFSSAQSFSGNAGQSNYTAGCTFKDGFADYLRQVVPYDVKTINWGYWGEVGVVAGAEYNRRLAAQGIGSINAKEGMEAVRRILKHPVDQVMPVRVERHILESMGVDFEHCIRLNPATDLSVFDSVKQIGDPPYDAQRLGSSRQAFDEVAGLGQELLLSACQQLGVLTRADETYEKETLRNQIRIAPAYFRLFEALLEILRGAGFIRMDGTVLTSTARVEHIEQKNRLSALVERKQQLAETFPDVAAHVDLLWECAHQYPAILTGELPATDVMFPESSMRLVEAVYKGNVIVDRCNQLAAQSVAAYVKARLPQLPANGKIRILEVGAGTGGTTAAVLSTLSAYATQVQYVYTDLSAGFIQHGRKQFAETYPFVQFKVLNIENDVRAQGFVPGDFDILIAANVLHATRNLRTTLRNTKALLKSNGWLVLNEVTDVQDFTTLTFGLLDGWWRFDDPEIRLPGAPLLSPTLWETLLKEEGFKSPHIPGQTNHHEGRLGQNVILAESNGQWIESRPASISEKETASGTAEVAKRSVRTTPTRAETAISSSQRAVQVSSAAPPTVPPPDRTKPINEPETDRETLLARVEQTIAACVAEALTMSAEEIDPDRQFSEYGVDSIIGVDLINVINESLGLTLRTTALFDYGNVKDLAKLICENYASQLTQANAAESEDFDGPDSDHAGELILLEKLAGGELGTEQVYQMLEASYGQL